MEKIKNALKIFLITLLIVPGIMPMERPLDEKTLYNLRIGSDILSVPGKIIDRIKVLKDMTSDTEDQNFDIDLLRDGQDSSGAKIVLDELIKKIQKNDVQASKLNLSSYSLAQLISAMNFIDKFAVLDDDIKESFFNECTKRIRHAGRFEDQEATVLALMGYDKSGSPINSEQAQGLNNRYDLQRLYEYMNLPRVYSRFTFKKADSRKNSHLHTVKRDKYSAKNADGSLFAQIRGDKKGINIKAGERKFGARLPAESFPFKSVALNHQGSLLAVGGKRVLLLDIEELKQENEDKVISLKIEPHKRARALSFHPTEPLLYMGFTDGSLYVWDTKDNYLVKKKVFEGGPITQLHSDGNRLYLVNTKGLQLLTFDLEEIMILPLRNIKWATIFNEGNLIAGHDDNDKVTLWELNLNLKKKFTEDEAVFLLALSDSAQRREKLVICEHHNPNLYRIYKANPDLSKISPDFIQESCWTCTLTRGVKKLLCPVQ